MYPPTGVEINDKHIEVSSVRLMRKVRIGIPADTNLLTGSTVDTSSSRMPTPHPGPDDAGETELRKAECSAMLLVSPRLLGTDSFLSAASFQETTKVLTDAAQGSRWTSVA